MSSVHSFNDDYSNLHNLLENCSQDNTQPKINEAIKVALEAATSSAKAPEDFEKLRLLAPRIQKLLPEELLYGLSSAHKTLKMFDSTIGVALAIQQDPSSIATDFDNKSPLIDNRLFAHIFGDASIENTDLEGSTIRKNVTHLLHFLTEELKNTTDPLLKQEYVKMQTLLSSICYASGENTSIGPPLIASKIKDLPEGQSVLMEGGWDKNGTMPGHACLYEFKKKEGGLYDVYIYNSGAGSETYHDTLHFKDEEMEKTLICPYVKYQGVSLQDLGLPFDEKDPSLFKNLMTLKEDPALIGSSQENPSQKMYSLFAHLNRYRVDKETDLSAFMTPQRSGTCSYRCILAAMRNNSNDLACYKLFKMDLKIKTLELFYKQEFTTEPVSAEKKDLFLTALGKFSKSMLKLMKQGLLSQEKEIELNSEIANWTAKVSALPVASLPKPVLSVKIEGVKKQEANPRTVKMPPKSDSARLGVKKLKEEATVLLKNPQFLNVENMVNFSLTLYNWAIENSSAVQVHSKSVNEKFDQVLGVISEHSQAGILPMKMAEELTIYVQSMKDDINGLLPEILTLARTENPKELSSLLSDATLAISRLPKEQKISYIETLVDLIPIPPSNYWNEIPEEHLKTSLSSLRNIMSIYVSSIQGMKYCLPIHINTTWSLLAASHTLATRIDPELSAYGISYEELQKPNRFTPHFTKKEVERHALLIEYFKNLNGEKKILEFSTDCSVSSSDSSVHNQRYDEREYGVVNVNSVDSDIENMFRVLEKSPEAQSRLDEQVADCIDCRIGSDHKISERSIKTAVLLTESEKIFSDQNTSYMSDLLKVAYLAKIPVFYSLDKENRDKEIDSACYCISKFDDKEIKISSGYDLNAQRAPYLSMSAQYWHVASSERSRLLGLMSPHTETHSDEGRYENLLCGNSSRREFQMHLSTDLCEGTLQCQKIIYDYQEMIPSLENPGEQNLFFFMLFSPDVFNKPFNPTPLLETALQNPNFCKKMDEFIRNGLDYFENQQANGLPNISGCLFFSSLINRLQQIQPENSPLNLNVFSMSSKINTWLSSKSLSQEDKCKLHLQRILQYVPEEKLNESNLQEIMTSWLFLCQSFDFSVPNPKEEMWKMSSDKSEKLLGEHWNLVQHKEESLRYVHSLGSQLQNASNEFLNNVLSSVLQKTINCDWTCSRFPVYTGSDGTNEWECNLLTGETVCNEQFVKAGILKDISTSKAYKKVFGEASFTLSKIGETFTFRDDQGNNFSYFERKLGGKIFDTIQIDIDGKPFQYLFAEDAIRSYGDKIPLTLLTDHHLFFNGKEVVLLHKESRTVALRVFDTKEVLEDLEQTTEYLTDLRVPALSAFEDSKWHLYEKDRNEMVSIRLPRFQALSSASELQFIQQKKEGPFLWSEDPAFQLVEPAQEDHPVGVCPNFIKLLDPDSNREKILLPIKPIAQAKDYIPDCKLDLQDNYRKEEYNKIGSEIEAPQVHIHSFIEYDVNGAEASPVNLEGRIYLSYLHLAQKHPHKALELLTGPKFIEVTPVIEKMLLWMCALPTESASSTASSAAVALRAGILLSRHYKKTSPEKVIPSNLNDKLMGLYVHYANGINGVEGGLFLSKNEMQELKKTLGLPQGKDAVSQRALSSINSGKREDLPPTVIGVFGRPRSLTANYLDFYEKVRKADSSEERFYYLAQDLLEHPGSADGLVAHITRVVVYWDELASLFPHVQLPSPLTIAALKQPPFDIVSFGKIEEHFYNKQHIHIVNTDKHVSLLSPQVTMKVLSEELQNVLPSEEPVDLSVPLKALSSLGRSPCDISSFIQENFRSEKKVFKDVSLTFSSIEEFQPYAKAVQTEKSLIQKSFLAGQEKNREESVYTIKNGSLDDLKNALGQKIATGKNDLEIQKNTILALINTKPSNSEQAILSARMKGSGYLKDVEFEQVVMTFLDGTRESYLKLNAHLSADQIEELDQSLGEFLIKSNEVKQMQRAELLSSESLIGKVLSEKMEYDPKERIFLVFEHRADIRMQPKQVDLVRKMLITNDKGVYKDCVSQLMMGGGKTSVLATILLQIAAKPGRIAFYVPPSSQFSTLQNDLAERQQKNFSRHVIPMNYKREDLTVERLNWMKEQFANAMSNQEIILATPETLQILPLELKNLLCTPISKRTDIDNQKIKLLDHLVQEMQSHGDVLIDEIDVVLSAKTETIFTQGKKSAISKEEVDLVQEIMTLHLDPDELGIQQNNQGSYGIDRYKKEVLPKIAERFFENRPEFSKYKEYILDPSKPEGVFAQENPSVEILKNIFKHLSTTLSRSTLQSYDRALSGSQEAVIPYAGAGNATTREFGTTTERALYHFQTVLFSGVSESQLRVLASRLVKTAIDVAQSKGIPFSQTAEVEEFKKITGANLSEFLYSPSPELLEQALKFVNEDYRNRLAVENKTILNTVGSYESYLVGSAQNFSSSFASVRGFSGTPWNHCGYPQKLQENLYLDLETEGRIIDKCLQKETKDSVRIVDEPTIKGLLDANRAFVRGIIDSSGMLKEIGGEAAARQIMDQYKDKPEIQTVLFFGKDGSLWGLKKRDDADPEIIRIGSTEKKTIAKFGIKPESTFVYYDEYHSEGTDIVQSKESLNIISIDHKTSLRTSLQGILRLRDFFNNQGIQYDISKQERHHFPEEITVSAIIEQNVKNQAELKVKEFGKSCKHKVDAFFEDLLFSLGRSEGSLEKYKDFFLHSSTAPYPRDIETYGRELLDKYKNIIGNEDLYSNAQKQLEVLLSEFETSPYACAQLEEGDSQIEVEVQKETEEEVTVESLTTTEMQREIEMELNGYRGHEVSSLCAETNWDTIGINSFKATPHPDQQPMYTTVHTVSEILQRLPYKNPYHELFPENLLVSYNFTHVSETLFPVFAKEQKEGKQILFIKEGNDVKAVMLSCREGALFKKFLNGSPQENMWLLLPDGTSYTDSNPPKEYQDKIDNLLWHVNLFNGDVFYLSRSRDKTQSMMQDNELRRHYLQLKVQDDPDKKAIFNANSILSQKA